MTGTKCKKNDRAMWLDTYLKKGFKFLKVALPDDPKFNEIRSDRHQALRFIVDAAESTIFRNLKARGALSLPPGMVEHSIWFWRLKPFAYPDTERPALAIALTDDAVECFSEASVSESIWRVAQEVLVSHPTVYIDLPRDRTLFGSTLALNAMLLTSLSEDEYLASAILAKPGSSQFRRINWLVKNGKVVDVRNDEFTSSMEHELANDLDDIQHKLPSVAEEVEKKGLTLANVVEDANSIALLALTAWKIQTEQADRSEVIEARIKSDRFRSGRKLHSSRNKRPSLFKAVVLNRPATLRENVSFRKGGTHVLGVRIFVRGHFKVQRFGHAWAFRRIIWVAPYEKGDARMPSPPVALYQV